MTVVALSGRPCREEMCERERYVHVARTGAAYEGPRCVFHALVHDHGGTVNPEQLLAFISAPPPRRRRRIPQGARTRTTQASSGAAWCYLCSHPHGYGEACAALRRQPWYRALLSRAS